MRTMIFAAGLGTRLRPLTDTLPKALVPVDGQPLLHRLLLKLQAAGNSHAVINVHHHARQIIDFLANHDYGMKIDISDERNRLLDTGGGLRHAATLFTGEEPILIHNVDILSTLSFEQLIAAHRPENLATLVVSERKTTRYLMFDSNKLLRGWYNSTTGESKPSELPSVDLTPRAFAGIHIVSPRIFSLMSDFPDKFSIIDLYLKVMQKENITAYAPSDFAMLDVGKTETLAAADRFVKEHL